MSNIGTIGLFVGVAIAGVIVWEIRRAPRVELAAATTQPLSREQPLRSVDRHVRTWTDGLAPQARE